MHAKMTLPKIMEWIEKGRGTGIGDSYTPWIMPSKRGTSSTSNQSYVPMPMLRRHCFFLSRGERHLAHVFWWLGVLDVREQFPLWPWPHPHPMSEVVPERRWPDHPGMDAVADEAGIRVYSYAGLGISHVLTIDLMVTLHAVDGSVRLLGVSCKPRERFERAELGNRLRERLELDRRYCNACGISHMLIHPEQLPPVLVRQLEWLAPLAPYRVVQRLVASDPYQCFVQHLRETAYTNPICKAATAGGEKLRWNPAQIRFAMHTALWRQDLEVDLSRPLSTASPLPRGGERLRQKLAVRLLGESA